MYRGRTLSLSLPPFHGWVKRIVLTCAIVYFLEAVLRTFSRPAYDDVMQYLGLVPGYVLHWGMIWQLVSYSVLHAGVWHVLINMIMLWMFGGQEEEDWGSKKFLEFYLFCVVGAALTTIAVAYLPLPGGGPGTITVGASGGIYGLLVAFGILYAEQRIYIYGIFPIKAKWFAIIWVALALFGALREAGGVANVAHLGGAAFGFAYVRWLPKRGFQLAFSELYYGSRNRYHKWKRRQAAKKFQVYMREHDRSEFFDEHGNYRDPNARKGNGKGEDPSKWVH